MPTRPYPEWTSGGIAPDISVTNPWDWPQIETLFPLLSDIMKTTDSGLYRSLQDLRSIQDLYGHLPAGKTELKLLRANLKGYLQRSRSNEVLKARRRELWLLLQAVRMKLAAVLCKPNQKSWCKRAYQFRTAMELNLGRMDRVYFLTLTFPDYEVGDSTFFYVARDRVRGVTRNLLYREGFETIDLMAFHPKPGNPGRLHTHHLLWSRGARTARDEKEALEGIRRAFNDNAYGVGLHTLVQVASLPATVAYLAYNYDRTIKLSKGLHNPIPRGARVLSLPKNLTEGRPWTRAGRFSIHSPSHSAFRAAVGRHAREHGYSNDGNWGWIWRERRQIREGMGPEPWISPSVTCLDGITYQVSAHDVDPEGDEVYLLRSAEHGRAYVLKEHALEELGDMDILPGCLEENPRLDPTTGLHACLIDIWLPAFSPQWSQRRSGHSMYI